MSYGNTDNNCNRQQPITSKICFFLKKTIKRVICRNKTFGKSNEKVIFQNVMTEIHTNKD